MQDKPRVVAAFVVVGALVFSACGADQRGSDANAVPGFPMTINSCGREVTIEQPPQRVATLGEGAATLMWAAGAVDNVVAKALDPDVPLGEAESALKDVPTFVPTGSPSRELIIAQQPDLVISYGLFNTTPDALAQAGIDSYVLSGYCGAPNTTNPDKDSDYEDIYDDIQLFGQLFATQEKAAGKVEDLRQRVEAVRDRVGSAPGRTAGALYTDGTSLLAYNEGTMAHAQMDILGLTNVFADVEGEGHAEINLEAIIARDPDQLILLSYEQTDEQAKQALLAQPGIETIRAVRENRIYVQPLAYSSSTLLAFEGLERMADQVLAPRS